MAALFCAKGSLKSVNGFSGCLWLIFCQSRRFAAYHEQGQAPALRVALARVDTISPLKPQGLLEPDIRNGASTHRSKSEPDGA